MAYGLNVFTGKLDLMGGGSAVISSAVATPADLPITLGTPAVGVTYLAQSASGTWFVNYRPAGLYRRTANVGTAADWQYLGAFPEANRDDRFRIYNSADTTKQLAIDVSGIATGTTRTLTAPNASGTIATTEAMQSLPAGSLWDGVSEQIGAQSVDGDFLIVSATGRQGSISPASLTANRNYTLPDASGTIMLGSLNLASLTNLPTARTNLGLGSGDSPTFTNLTLSRGTITTSSPFAITQTWNASGTTFTALDINVTNTASAAASALADFRIGGSRQLAILRAGEIQWNTTNTPALVPIAGGFNFRLFTSSNIISLGNPYTALTNAGYFGWSSVGDAANNASHDTRLYRDGIATLAQYNSTNAQTFRLYGTRTDASNGRWLNLGSTTGGRFTISATGNGTGASGNELVLASPVITPAASVSLGTNGDLGIEATSNTSLTFRYRGSDGTTRSASLTLS
jgi:hypothetical protein